MAVFRAGSIVGAISGRVGGVDFVQGVGGPVLRAAGRRSAAGSARAVAARAVIARVWAAWRALSEYERLAWTTAANSVQAINRVGVSRRMRGWEYYFQTVLEVYGGAPPPGLTPPLSSVTYRPTLLAVHFLEGGPYAVTASGAPLFAAPISERGYLQVGRGPLQVTGFNRAIFAGVITRAGATVDAYNEVAARGLPIFDGTRFAWASAWRAAGGIYSTRVWATGTVGDLPWVIDDFERGGLAYYTGATGKYSIVGAPVISGTRALRATLSAADAGVQQIYSSEGLRLYPVRGHVIEFWARFSGAIDRVGFFFGRFDDFNRYLLNLVPGGVSVLVSDLGGVSSTVITWPAFSWPADVWRRFVISWGSTGNFEVQVFDPAGGLLASATGTNTDHSAGGIGWRARNVTGSAGDVFFDACRVIGRA